MNFKYVKIDNNKVPLNSLEKTFDYEDIENDSAVAILVPEGYVVLDIDEQDHFDCLCNIIEDKDIKCKIMKSNRGGHFWFKTADTIPNYIDVNTPITLKTDIKCGGKKSLVTIKKDGRWRKWLRMDDVVDELPFWLKPIKYDKELYDLAEGDGRDSQLFSYIIPLMKKGFDKDQIYEIFNIINKYVFAEPLKQQEMDKMFAKNEIFNDKKMKFFKGKEFQHNIFADYMIERYNIKGYGRLPYIYSENVYQYNQDEINRKMLENIENLKRTQIQETFENIRLKVTTKEEKLNPFIVNLKNGLFDLNTFELIPHTSETFTVNQFDCSYDPNAKSDAVDKMIRNVTENKKELITLIEEMLGYFLIGDCRYQKAFILLGQGSNGKSKFLDMITNWIGKDNRSTLALEDLSEKFRTAELLGKIANVGDDSGGNILKNTAVFKKLVTGEGVTVERKNQHPFTLNNTSKMIFSVNSLPPSVDKSNGFFRRIIIIPFNAVFNSKNPDFDPLIINKVSTEEAKSYLFNLALKGFKRLIENDAFTIPNEVEEVVSKYEVDNNSVLQWIELNSDNIENRTMNEVYTDYCMYCNKNNQIAYQLRKFNTEIMKRFNDLEIITEGTKNIWRNKNRLD